MLYKDNYDNFGSLFLNSMKIYGERSVLKWKSGSEYRSLNSHVLKDKLFRCYKALEKLDLKKGDKTGIISENRWEWVVSDFGCIFSGIVTVPIYVTMTPQQILYILKHSGAKIVFISSEVQLDKILSIKNELPELQKIIIFSDIHHDDKDVINFNEFLNESDNNHRNILHYKKDEVDNFLKDKTDEMNIEDLLTIIYTSGTTGIPKGVCLTQKNIISNLISCTKAFHIDDTDIFLSYLPLAHTYERTAGYYLPILLGCEIVYTLSIDTISSQLQEVKPTVMTSVPVLFSKMYNKLIKTKDTMSGMRKKIFNFGIDVAADYDKTKGTLKWKVADKLVYKKIREKLGGRIRFFISGGSAMNKEVAEKFEAFGIKLLEGYGMTEASPVISVNRENKYKFGTVGFPLDGVNVKIAEDGEILVHGDNVMQGYYLDDEETRKTIVNSWLHTGDIGEFDEEGFLKITDRKKSLFKTAGGKYISLTHIEDVISSSRFINQVLATGGDRMFVTALIVPDFEELKEIARTENISYKTNDDLIINVKIRALLDKEISERQEHLAKYEKVRRYKILNRPFSIESGELTPTLKLKRKLIEEKFGDFIEEMYDLKKR